MNPEDRLYFQVHYITFLDKSYFQWDYTSFLYVFDNKEKDITEDQINTFLSVFRTIENEQQKDGALMEIDKDTIGGAILRQRLIETGKFEDNDIIDNILASMIKFGRIEKVSCDTYRRRKEN